MKLRIFIALVIAVVLNVKMYSQDEVASVEKAEALFIYNFSRHIGWPEASLTSGEFVISVIGNKSLYNEILNLSVNKTVGKNKIVVKYVATPAEATNSHMLVIGSKFRKNAEELKTKFSSFPTLIINSGDNNSVASVGIGFKMVDQKMNYLVNRNNIKSKGLTMSKRLEEMAMLVE